MPVAPRIYVALPVMAESAWLPACLESISRQKNENYHIVACVNQPESYHTDENKKHICADNLKCLEILSNVPKEKITLIDHSSDGKGWLKKSGIGYARKIIMDKIASEAEMIDLILSLDADTTFSEYYFTSVIEKFRMFPHAVALSNPYYHNLTGSKEEDRAILHYEIYMRNYAINLLLIDSPYAFTALGSAIAVPVSSYKAVGGMTAKLSGEDFYFLQKLKKYGNIIIHNHERVHPAARFSDRVFFGTGPAMIKGSAGDWSSYPLYHHSLFSDIRETYQLFPSLFQKKVNTPMSDFLKEQFNEEDIWVPIRKNYPTLHLFVRSCHEKVDGLRILQYLKQKQDTLTRSDEQCLADNINDVFNKIVPFNTKVSCNDLDFNKSSIKELDVVRNYLVTVEELLQKKTGML
jgi:hypothetical protein